MSWGSGEGASAAGSAAPAASSASNMPTSVSGYSSPTQGPSGFSINANSPANQGQGPTVAAGNVQTYGTSDPSIMQQAGNTLDRFQKGANAKLGDVKWDNSPETYGYLYGKANTISGLAKQSGGGAAPITTNISYQQPTRQKQGRYW